MKIVQDAEVRGKKVFLRADLDVPIKDGQIKDETRLKAWFGTLEYLLKNQAIVTVAGHLGRPSGVDQKLSLQPIVIWLGKALELHNDPKEVLLEDYRGWKLADNLFVLENLRFYKQEEENDEEFAKKLAKLADIYVNDAFASTHRDHASIALITKYLPSFAGFRLQKEVEELSRVLDAPKRPLTIIIGGAKIETKLPLVEKMHRFADFVLVGGEIAENTKVLLKVQHERISDKKSALLVADLTENSKDITDKSAENFVQISKSSNTIVWNGPLGLVEEDENAKGTKILAQELSKLSCNRIVGGGDTIAFLEKDGLLDKFSFVSMGGGAMLEFLAGEKLPGLEALKN